MDSRNHFLATSKDETSGLKELPRSTTNLSSHKPRQFSGCTWNRKFVYSFCQPLKSIRKPLVSLELWLFRIILLSDKAMAERTLSSMP